MVWCQIVEIDFVLHSSLTRLEPTVPWFPRTSPKLLHRRTPSTTIGLSARSSARLFRHWYRQCVTEAIGLSHTNVKFSPTPPPLPLGFLHQVDSSVCVSWVQPRILTKPQIAGLKLRLDAWIGKVAAVTTTLESESVGVVA